MMLLWVALHGSVFLRQVVFLWVVTISSEISGARPVMPTSATNYALFKVVRPSVCLKKRVWPPNCRFIRRFLNEKMMIDQWI